MRRPRRSNGDGPCSFEGCGTFAIGCTLLVVLAAIGIGILIARLWR